MTDVEKERKLLEKLLVNESTILEELVNQAEGIVGVDKTTGEPIILAEESAIGDRERIFLVLLGKYFSFRLGKSKSESYSSGEIASKLGLEAKTASARLSELKDKRTVETTNEGRYRVVYANARGALVGVKNKLGKTGGH